MPSRISQMRNAQIQPQSQTLEQQPQINEEYLNQLKALMNSKNAPEFLAQLAQSNPQFQQLFSMYQNGGNLQAIFENLAHQKNIDPKIILQKLLN